ncbi:MAG: GTP cyclohydrolase II, partial [Pseudomonadota bacterium]
MSLTLTAEERVARARADLRMGAPIVLVSQSGGALVLAAETVSDARLAEIRALGPREIDIAISDHRAETLKARAYDGKLARVVLSDRDDARFVRATADPAGDLATPMKGPYLTRRDGPSDLHGLALNLVKQARLLPAAVVAVWSEAAVAERLGEQGRLSVLSEIEVHRAAEAAIRMQLISGAKVPTRFAEAGKVHVYRPEDGGEEHYAVEVGRPGRSTPVLSRLHSACFTGDV